MRHPTSKAPSPLLRLLTVLVTYSFVMTTTTPNITLHVLVDNFSSMTVTYSPTDLELLYTTEYLIDVGTLYVNQCPHMVQPGVCKFNGRDPEHWMNYIPKSYYRFMLLNRSDVMHDEVVNTAHHVKVARVSRAQFYNIDSRSADVTWSHEIKSELLIYRITLLNSEGFVLRGHMTHNNTYHLDDLLPYHNYSVSIEAKTNVDGYWSDDVVLCLETLQDVPSSGPDIIPGGFKYHLIDSSSHAQVTVYWNTAPTIHHNGRLLSYAGYDVYTHRQVFEVAAGYSAASFDVPTDQSSTIAVVSSTSAGYGNLNSASLLKVPSLSDIPECEGIVYVAVSNRNLVSVDINMECRDRSTEETLVIQDYQVMHCEQTEPAPECFRQVTVSEMFALHRRTLTRAMTLDVQDARNVIVGVSLRVKTRDSLCYSGITLSDCAQDPVQPPVPPMHLAALFRGDSSVTLKWLNPDCGVTGSTYVYVINICDVTDCAGSLHQVSVYRNRNSYDINMKEIELQNAIAWMHGEDTYGRRSENTSVVILTYDKESSSKNKDVILIVSLVVVTAAVIAVCSVCLVLLRRRHSGELKFDRITSDPTAGDRRRVDVYFEAGVMVDEFSNSSGSSSEDGHESSSYIDRTSNDDSSRTASTVAYEEIEDPSSIDATSRAQMHGDPDNSSTSHAHMQQHDNVAVAENNTYGSADGSANGSNRSADVSADGSNGSNMPTDGSDESNRSTDGLSDGSDCEYVDQAGDAASNDHMSCSSSVSSRRCSSSSLNDCSTSDVSIAGDDECGDSLLEDSSRGVPQLPYIKPNIDLSSLMARNT